MTVKTFHEPPGADPHAVVVWGELEKSQPLPDLGAFIESGDSVTYVSSLKPN